MRSRVPGRAPVVTVAGPHGSGRTTQAERLAETFKLRYVSVGTLFRDRAKELGISLEEMTRIAAEGDAFDRYLDDRTKKESRKGGVVIDATLSAWMADRPDVRIYLTAPIGERVHRIAERERRDPEEVRRETEERESAELKRFRRYYSVDLSDLTVYDMVLNTGPLAIEEVANILKCLVKAYLGSE